MKKNLIIVLLASFVLLLLLGCTGQGTSGKTIRIPHTGENAILQPNYSSWGWRGGSESYASISDSRNITWYFANGPGGNSHEVYYSDKEIEYTYSYSGDELYQYYRCIRGQCGILIDAMPFGNSFKGNSCPNGLEMVACLQNGTYIRIKGEQEASTQLFKSKSMDENDFRKAQSEYNEKNNVKISITLSQDDVGNLLGWRPVCKYPFEVYTGGADFDPFNHDNTDYSNYLWVGRMNMNFTNETGIGCPDR